MSRVLKLLLAMQLSLVVVPLPSRHRPERPKLGRPRNALRPLGKRHRHASRPDPNLRMCKDPVLVRFASNSGALRTSLQVGFGPQD